MTLRLIENAPNFMVFILFVASLAPFSANTKLRYYPDKNVKIKEIR
ncbi:hypothetical protein A33Q_4579 [Indibacter alkaliphilus LW1]|uniref:Uncharacterized protein n=1 Tax=Indibacter alkaliphilus (strain CCUG 57479 / KCTC 22604 / LW1) TaxID=1189612 RepID=S2DHH3_INDAL|nr:hypothetical protein A33Q_4579 [Indibacter alkaliphilus LW1]